MIMLAGCGLAGGSPLTPNKTVTASATGSVADAVRALPVAEADRAAQKAYSGHREDLFGRAWTDDNTIPRWSKNRCKTRGDALKRDLSQQVFKYGKCAPHTGVLHDVYSGRTITFRSGMNPSAIEIDHIVPLSNAFAHGAQRWSQQKRIDFANDPLVLQSVARDENQRKSDGGAADFMPSNPRAACGYIAAQTAVLTTYQLTVTGRDKAAMLSTLTKCPPSLSLPTRESSYTLAPVREVS